MGKNNPNIIANSSEFLLHSAGQLAHIHPLTSQLLPETVSSPRAAVVLPQISKNCRPNPQHVQTLGTGEKRRFTPFLCGENMRKYGESLRWLQKKICLHNKKNCQVRLLLGNPQNMQMNNTTKYNFQYAHDLPNVCYKTG